MSIVSRNVAAALICVIALGCGGTPAEKPVPPPPPSESVPANRSAVTGTLAAALGEAGTVIVLDPATGELPIKPEPAIMDQAGYEFLPGFLVAQAGQTVQFRNSEDVLHNVRVTEVAGDKPIFNVATIAFGTYEHKFERPGYYAVGCDIHSTMRADILVTASPYTTKAGKNGTFTLTGVPAGSYSLTVYSGGSPNVRNVEVKSGRTDLGVIQ